MSKIQNFFSRNGYIIMCSILFLILMQMCSQKSAIKSCKQEIKNQRLCDSINKINTIYTIKLEGLKSEKRMIQATDRKMIDVMRQSELDKEIKKLENDDK